MNEKIFLKLKKYITNLVYSVRDVSKLLKKKVLEMYPEVVKKRDTS